jgi:hypothetical protein
MLIDLDSHWDSLVRDDETSTFFQTPAWHKLAEDFEGTRTRLLPGASTAKQRGDR